LLAEIIVEVLSEAALFAFADFENFLFEAAANEDLVFENDARLCWRRPK